MLARLHHQLIVSCQAPADSPLHDAGIIAAIAQAAVNQGAAGLRIDSPAHVAAVRQRLPATPIIGLWKQQLPDSEVYITPRWRDAVAIAEAGADIIALDATLRPRPDGDTATDLIHRIQQELGKPVMADIDTWESAQAAAAAGAELIGTTLYGYTTATHTLTPPGWDLLATMVMQLDVPVICEGGVATPAMARQALDQGAYAVVVGTAITGVDALARSFQAAIATV
ncbi:MAG: N-acetylmannosamine-6-phosphate 2-epimerase [Spirulinaceae cyanobacterium SM2_1_0]|nr:N-acetylmannosamine-6-phosphate 2-epimerase [Spirulinaceae cyanobacterium SM2_1_0]